MENLTIYLIYIASFAVIALTSMQTGRYFKQHNLPLITRFLLTGIITGPFLLNLISVGAISNLRFIDESIFARGMGSHILWVGLLMGFRSLSIENRGWITNSAYWPTMVFTTITLSQMAHALAIRSENQSMFKRIYSKVKVIKL